MRPSAGRIVQWAAGAAILAWTARALATNWGAFRAADVRWEVRPALVAASALLVWTMYALLVQAWRVMLAGWGERLAPWPAARIWTVSSLGKYVPGKLWAIAGMAVMAQQAGVAAWAATGSAVILQALAVGTGAAVAAVTGMRVLEAAHPGAGTWLLLLAAASATGVALLAWPPATRRLLALAGRGGEGTRSPGAPAILFGTLANVAAWAGYGTALWLLARGMLPGVDLSLPAAIGAFAGSYVAGLLALVAPGGLGVREGVFILMLQAPLGIASATALAVASRLLLTVTEIGAAVPFLLTQSRPEPTRVHSR